MIKSLKILNYQSHEKSSLEFSDGVNVIVGQSDSGKSAIIRSLRWLVWNRPSGDSFRSTWGGATSVLLETEEGIVCRSKDKKDKYELKKQDNWGTPFEAFGTNVPEEITAFLNINEINLQHQLDAPFLLSLSPGQVAQHFNAIAKLDQIDRGLSNINKSIRSLNDVQNYKQNELIIEKDDLSKYKHLEKFEAEVEVLEQMQNQLRSLQNSKQTIDSKIYDYKQADSFIRQHKVLLADEKKVENLLALIEKKNKLIAERKELRRHTKEILIIRDAIKEAQDYASDEPLVDNLLALYKNVKPLNEAFSSLSKLIIRTNNISNLLETERTNLTLLEGKFHKLMPDVCPLCGQSIKR